MDAPDGISLIEPKLGGNSKQTAKKAAEILLSMGQGYVVPTGPQRRHLLVAFAERGLTLYGQAYDIIRGPSELSLDDPGSIRRHFDDLLVFEIKSTDNLKVGEDFSRHFFSISTAELLTAQNLRHRYRFVFVNVRTRNVMECSLQEVYGKARGIYPTWSIQF